MASATNQFAAAIGIAWRRRLVLAAVAAAVATATCRPLAAQESALDRPMPADPSPLPVEEVAPQGGRPVPRGFRPITLVNADARLPAGLLPEQVERQADETYVDQALPEVGDPRLLGGWGDQVYFWSATKLCHGPLYFEEVNLERYGYQCHPALQPFVSGAHFFLTAPTLPYQMTVHPPRECIYTLGHYRPGNRVPWQRHRLPLDARAAAVEAGVVVGLVFLIP